MSKQTLSFRPRARLIRTIGDRLISGPETAVIELVKNSHDADASYVRIAIEPAKYNSKGAVIGEGQIIVEDDGHGMSLNDIEQRWMEPATTDKLDRLKSPDGRPLLGSKGIGRFATARLGRNLNLTTTAKLPVGAEQFQTTKIPDIDWDMFDKVKYLSDIEFNFETSNTGDSTGTRLVIKYLRDTWSETRLRELHKQLRRLISPLEQADKAEFKIYLDLSAFTHTNSEFDGAEIVNGPIVDGEAKIDLHRIIPFPLLNSCDYEVSGEFDMHGHFSGTMTIHRGALEPENIDLEIPLEEGQEDCGLVLVQLYIFDRESDALKSAMRRASMGDVTVKQARSIVDDLSGVALYRDKFRLRPYGDNDNDWLTLDMRRVQNPSMRIGHNQVSGILVISDEQTSGLVERSSREGLEENSNYRRLRHLLDILLSKEIEPSRFAFRDKADIERNKSNVMSKAFTAAEFLWAPKLLSNLPEDVRLDAENKIESESKALNAYLKQLESAQAKLEAQVTLGLIVGEVLHEGRSPVAYIFDQARRLSRWWPIILQNNEESEKARTEIPAILRGTTKQAERLRDLFRALKPLAGGKRGHPKRFNPNQVIIDTFSLFDGKFLEGQVKKVHRDTTGGKDILGYGEDLATAMTNIVDNALFWLGYHKVEKPMLTVTVDNESKYCVIKIADNGTGIPDEFRHNIFDVGFSLKPQGTGLGLSIAQEAIGRSKGTITLDDISPGTGFTIRIPYGA